MANYSIFLLQYDEDSGFYDGVIFDECDGSAEIDLSCFGETCKHLPTYHAANDYAQFLIRHCKDSDGRRIIRNYKIIKVKY